MVVEQRRAFRARAHHQHAPSRRLQQLAHRRRREQALFAARDRARWSRLAVSRNRPRIDRREEHRVAEQPVRLGIRAGGNRRRVHARNGGIHRMVMRETTPRRPSADEVRHHAGGDVVWPQAVDSTIRWRWALDGDCEPASGDDTSAAISNSQVIGRIEASAACYGQRTTFASRRALPRRKHHHTSYSVDNRRSRRRDPASLASRHRRTAVRSRQTRTRR